MWNIHINELRCKDAMKAFIKILRLSGVNKLTKRVKAVSFLPAFIHNKET